MEQVFAGLHGIYSKPLDFKDKFFYGKDLDYYSFEMVGNSGETHFYIRTLEKFKNIVEAQVYAQYPEAEIFPVPDYVNEMPLSLPDDNYDVWGTDMMLSKPDAFPIRTYPDFEEKGTGPDDVKRIDPLASLSELFSTLRNGEKIWIQITAAPVGDGWIKRGQAEIDKIMGKTPTPKGDFLSDMVFSIDKAISNIGPSPTVVEGAKVERKEEKKERVEMTPGKQEIIKAMEKSWDKLGYETVIRTLYLGPKNAFNPTHAAGISGSFRQFASQNLNGFKGNKYTLTYAKGLFKKSKLLTRKRAIYSAYKERKLFNPMVLRFTLNTEEMATIFHFPDVGVRSPLLPRVEAKKGEPPSGLPVM